MFGSSVSFNSSYLISCVFLESKPQPVLLSRRCQHTLPLLYPIMALFITRFPRNPIVRPEGLHREKPQATVKPESLPPQVHGVSIGHSSYSHATRKAIRYNSVNHSTPIIREACPACFARYLRQILKAWVMKQRKPYSAITVHIDRLTSEQFEEDEIGGIPDLVDVIRLQDSGPTEAARALRKKLQVAFDQLK